MPLEHRVAVEVAAAPAIPVESNDALFWESMRALMVLSVGRGGANPDIIKDSISFCVEQSENRLLSADDRDAWRKLSEHWKKRGVA